MATLLPATQNALVIRPPFDSADAGFIPGPPSVLALVGGPSWNPCDQAIRRFSELASSAERQRLDADLSSAKTAYLDAVRALHSSMKRSEVQDLLQESTTSTVEETARKVHNAQPGTVESSKLNNFVDSLQYYQGVFDVFSQCGVPYLTLLWGGMKVVLIMLKNRSDLLVKITDMLVDIGLNLSRIELYVKLFPTTRMIELTSMLYAAVVEFIKETILHTQKSAIRRVFSSFRPFEQRYGRAVARIKRLEENIHRDARAGAMLLQFMQARSLERQRVDVLMQRNHVETTLNTIEPGKTTGLFHNIKHTLFRGFEVEASYHEDLASIYSVTSEAWKDWFGLEQRYLPSTASHKTRLVQGLCDAADAQHALQWAAQQKKNAPHLPAAYLIWARGMTAQSAIACLIFQILQQRPDIISKANLNMSMFSRANSSIKALWDLFVHLMRTLGGCLVYISIGSAGPDEFAVVEKFVNAVRAWDGPPICVTIIHPFKGFALGDDVRDLDGAYDVHPSLTTTDALHHVLLLELNVHSVVSETIRTVLWEAVWRETRYAVIGIALNEVLNHIWSSASAWAQEFVESARLGEGDQLRFWEAGVTKWMEDSRCTNGTRECIQRHLDIVDLELPEATRADLSRRVRRIVLVADTDNIENIATRRLRQSQRDRIWARIGDKIKPRTAGMFCRSIGKMTEEALEDYCEIPPRTERQAFLVISESFGSKFGWDGSWKDTFSDDKELITNGIVDGISTGFADVISTLLEPQAGGDQEG